MCSNHSPCKCKDVFGSVMKCLLLLSVNFQQAKDFVVKGFTLLDLICLDVPQRA